MLFFVAMKTTQAVRALRARPVHAVAVMLALFTTGNALLAGCGGNKAETTTETTTESTPPVGEATTDTSAMAGGGDIAAGQKIYQERCVLCHGATGVGDGPGAAALNPKPRNHTDGAYMNARTDAELHDVINNGKGAMPAWKGVLTEQQINDVLRYVRSLAVPPYAG